MRFFVPVRDARTAGERCLPLEGEAPGSPSGGAVERSETERVQDAVCGGRTLSVTADAVPPLPEGEARGRRPYDNKRTYGMHCLPLKGKLYFARAAGASPCPVIRFGAVFLKNFRICS